MHQMWDLSLSQYLTSAHSPFQIHVVVVDSARNAETKCRSFHIFQQLQEAQSLTPDLPTWWCLVAAGPCRVPHGLFH